MEGLELNPATRIMWKSVKPLLMGQILYAPDSPAVRQIIKNVSCLTCCTPIVSELVLAGGGSSPQHLLQYFHFCFFMETVCSCHICRRRHMLVKPFRGATITDGLVAKEEPS